jgi:hypothetical protein
VGGFYETIFTLLKELDINIKINPFPAEMPHSISMEDDHTHKTYDEDQVRAFHKALVAIQNVFLEFRAGFNGKASPIQLFWGGFDFSLTLFSGKKAPKYPGNSPGLPDAILQDAYSHEICEHGFTLGSKDYPEASFYASIYPANKISNITALAPKEAIFDQSLGSFSLSYAQVQNALNPDEMLRNFLETTYLLCTEASEWDSELWKAKEAG